MQAVPKPVHVEQVFQKVRITERSNRSGDGVARIEGLVVFVSDTVVGDIVSIMITRVGSRHAEAQVVE